MVDWTLPHVVSVCFRHGAIVPKRCDRLARGILAALRKGFSKIGNLTTFLMHTMAHIAV
ncbi:MAG: hypothetical protein ICV55_12205 [Coleofasciculus sp. C3-bin4]|nr:hypothetical protein [Coleofasciculus sp. C3-bin4]